MRNKDARASATRPRRHQRSADTIARISLAFRAALLLAAMGLALASGIARAQAMPKTVIDEDCSAFAVSQNNQIVCSVPQQKTKKKLTIERDDIWVVSSSGSKKKILEGEKFMPLIPPTTYVIESLAWSPDNKKIAVSMTIEPLSDDEDEPAEGKKAILLLDEDGTEIHVAGLKTRFIEGGIRATWLADDQSVVYLSPGPPYEIHRVRPADGKFETLFDGKTVDALQWNAKRNEAYVVETSLSVMGKQQLAALDLLHESVREITRLPDYDGELSVSESGRHIGYFADGDTLEVRDVAHPFRPIRVNAGKGRFEWSADETRVLLKRGPEDRSGDLVWVGLKDGSFTPLLHDLEFHDFKIAPDGRSIVLAQVGKRSLMVYELGK